MFFITNNFKSSFLKTIYFSFTLFLVSTLVASAATINFSPRTGAYNVGSTFSIKVYVASSDQAMNAVSGVVSFPNDILSVTSISKSGSIISLWAQEPTYSNSGGTVNFEGVVMTPGFMGGSGNIITINFKAKTTGDVALAFSSGAVLANDGLGTNIMTTTGSAAFTIVPGVPAPETPVTPTKKPKETTVTPSILPVATSTLEAPVITQYPKEVQSAEIFAIKGIASVPDTQVQLSIQNANNDIKNYFSMTGKDNTFTFFINDIFNEGLYTVSAQLVSDNGTKSSSSEKVNFAVKQPVFFKIGSWSMSIAGTLLFLIN